MRSTALPPRPPPWTVAAGSGTCHPLLLAWSGLGTAACGGGAGADGGGSPDSCRPGEAPLPPGLRVRVDPCVSVCSWLPQVHYTFNKVLMLQEPLLVVAAFYVLFFTVIVYVRLDFSITKVPNSAVCSACLTRFPSARPRDICLCPACGLS